jgi:CRP-like cAMP-binding protein
MRPSRAGLHDHLRRSPVLGQLSAAGRTELLERGWPLRVAAGETLFALGDPCEAILVVLRGRVRLFRDAPDGQLLALHVAGPGEILGQMSALDPGGAHSISAAAEEELELFALPSARFRAVLEAEPRAALRLAAVLAARVRSLSDELLAMKYRSLSERVLARLRALAQGRRELRITHQMLAEAVGATRENVSRVLGALRDAGILRLGRGRIEVLDHERLAGPAPTTRGE